MMSQLDKVADVVFASIPSKVELYLHGDVLLKLQDLDLLVSSHVLSLASPVFSAMVSDITNRSHLRFF